MLIFLMWRGGNTLLRGFGGNIVWLEFLFDSTVNDYIFLLYSVFSHFGHFLTNTDTIGILSHCIATLV